MKTSVWAEWLGSGVYTFYLLTVWRVGDIFLELKWGVNEDPFNIFSFQIYVFPFLSFVRFIVLKHSYFVGVLDVTKMLFGSTPSKFPIL